MELVKKYGLLFIIITALILKLFYLLELSANPLPGFAILSDIFDQHRFFILAQSFLHSGWLSSDIAWFSPAYSYFIALILHVLGENFYNVFFVQIIIGSLSVLVIYRIAFLEFDNQLTALLSAFLFAFYAPFLFYECTLLRASLLTYTNLCGFYFLTLACRKKNTLDPILAGIAFGISMALRPHILPFLGCVYLYLKTKNAGIRTTGFFVLAFVLILSPLFLRNILVGQQTLISSQGSSVFWIGNTHDATGVGLYRSPLREQFAKEAEGRSLKTAGIFLREIKKHPKEYVLLYLRKIYGLLNGYEIPANLSFDQFFEESKILKYFLFNAEFVIPLGLLGMVLAWRQKKKHALLYLFVLTLSLGVVLFHVQSRYRLVLMPYVILFAAYAVTALAQQIYRREILSLCVSLCILTCAILLNTPRVEFIQRYFSYRIRPGDYSNMAYAYHFQYRQKEHTLSQAEKTELLNIIEMNLEKAIYYSHPQNKDFLIMSYVNLGHTYWSNNRKEKALKAFNKALLLNPDDEELKRIVAEGKI